MMAELSWSVSAMNDATERLRKAAGRDLLEALALVAEAVWWVILVEATIMRTSQAAYDQALAARIRPARVSRIRGRVDTLCSWPGIAGTSTKSWRPSRPR
jgi:hypothetical protein